MSPSEPSPQFLLWLDAMRRFAKSRFDDPNLRRRAIEELPDAPGSKKKRPKARPSEAAGDKWKPSEPSLELYGIQPGELHSKKARNQTVGAARSGNLAKLKFLIEKGAEPNGVSSNGEMPLVEALFLRDKLLRSEVIRYLISRGANVEAKSQYGEVALYYPLLYGEFQVAKLLIEAGADPNRFSFSMLHQAAAWGTGGERASRIANAKSLEILDAFGRTPWLVAVLAGNVEAAGHFAAAGASKRAFDSGGDSALHLAAKGNGTKMIKSLLAKHPDLEAKNGEGRTPLHAAVFNDSLEAASLLLGAGAKVEVDDKQWERPINLVQSTRVLELLINHDADLNYYSGMSWPLKEFVENGNLEAIHLLLSHGANPDEEHLGTALHTAIGFNELSAAVLLLEFGADVDARDLDFDTPLDYSQTAEAIALLRFYGANEP